ncbi:MAG: lipoate--protein ligase family protein [Candidatus Heimdallarchaeaceae archaeon]|jgi:lipoate-protein ligase A
MSTEWRLLNLGEIPWLRSQSIYHALAIIQDRLQTPNTLIINWPNRPFVCIGLHQIVENSVELSFLRDQELPLVRRACGGGSVYLDQNQVFYQLICNQREYPQQLREFYEFFLQPVIETYREFNIPAQYSPVNDIIAEGRKISGNGAVSFGISRVLVGNFIFDFPAKEMSQILKVPEEKFRDKIANTLEERMGSFDFFLSEIPSKQEVISKYIENFQTILNVELVPDKLSEEEKKEIRKLDNQYIENQWLYYVEGEGDEILQQKIKSGTYFIFNEIKLQGGLFQIFAHFEDDHIADIILSGDFSISPPFILSIIQEKLKLQRVKEELITDKLQEIFKEYQVDLPGITIKEIVDLILKTYNSLKK